MKNDENDDLMRELEKSANNDASNEASQEPCPICNPQFRVGDVVRLNSGGPEMTVVDVNFEEEALIVEWHGPKSLQSHVFPIACVYQVNG